MGTLIVLEGLDGSGKATQTQMLCEALAKEGLRVRQISFPDYDSESSALVKMYLGGAFGVSPADVNPHAASSFYAVDRFASYQRDWKQAYLSGTVILADRYVTSNLIYQLSKVKEDEKEVFIRWVESYEYEKLGLPRPDVTLYLDMDPEISQRMLRERYAGDETKKDIHESNIAFLKDCRKNALYSAERLRWHVIPCYEQKEPKTREAIHREILKIVRSSILTPETEDL